jgi:hypothetical protein
MTPSDAAVRRLGPLLRPGERLVWADRPRHGLLRRLGLPPRTPAALLGSALGLSAAIVVLGFTLARATDPARAVLVVGLGLVAAVAAAVLAWRRPARALYAASDQGRGFVVEGVTGRTLVFALPVRIGVTASRDLELGDLDLGTLDVAVFEVEAPEEPEEAARAARQARQHVRLRAVAYPQVVADLLQGLVPLPSLRSSDRFDVV